MQFCSLTIPGTFPGLYHSRQDSFHFSANFINYRIFIFFFGGKMATKLGKTSGKTLKEIKGIKKSFSDAFDDDSSQNNKKEV